MVALRSLVVVAVAVTAVFVAVAAVNAVRDTVEIAGSAMVVPGNSDQEAEVAVYRESPPPPQETSESPCASGCAPLSPLSLSIVSQWKLFQFPSWGGL